MSKENWDKVGKNQKLFKVIEDNDEPIVKDQVIDNAVGKVDDKPKNGSKKDTNKSGHSHKPNTKSKP